MSIVVVGSLNMDLVVRAPRFAQPGETIAGDLFVTAPGGKGANQAVAARRLGAEVSMVGAVGGDAFGTLLRGQLADEGIDVRHVSARHGQASGVALITIDGSGENTIVIVGGANAMLTPGDVEQAGAVLSAAQVVVLQLEIPPVVVEAAATLARAGGATVVLNAAPALPIPDTLLAAVDVLVVNETELLALADDAGTHDEAVGRLRARGVADLVVTLGARGARLLPAAGDPLLVPAHPVEVVDTTAAGDAFVGGLAVALAERRSLIDAVRLGCAAGALAVTRLGAQPSLPHRAAADALLRPA